MVSQITLGNFFQLNGKTVLGGAGGSGLDTQSLIKSLTDAKSAPAKQDQDQIALNDKQAAALTTFQGLLADLQSASDALRNPPGVGNDADNVFKFTTASLTSNTAVPGGTYLSVSTSPGASLQSYSVSEISSLASAAQQSTDLISVSSLNDSAVSSAASPGLFHEGTVTINGQSIQLVSGDTLSSVAAKFNAVSDATGIAASIVQVSATQFQMSFVAKDTGTSHNFDLSAIPDPDGVLANISFDPAIAGTNANFKVNGIAISRETNSINDVISGVTFNLLQETPDLTTKVSVAVQPDTTTTQNTIVAFVKAYNAIKVFEAQQTQLKSDGTYADTAVLANDRTFLSAMNNVTAAVTAQVAGISSGQPSNLSAIGITFTTQAATDTTPSVSNILNVNDGQLTSALSTNFQGVENLFGFKMTSDNPNLKVFSASNSLSVNNVVFNFNPGANTFTATYDQGSGPVTVNLDATAISGATGYSVKGQVGTALEGLQLIYGSASTSTITANFTNGLASQAFNSINAATQDNTGTIPVALKAFQDSDTRLNTDIDNINQQVAIYQNSLVQQFSALEQAISNFNNLLNSLTANDNARLISSGH